MQTWGGQNLYKIRVNHGFTLIELLGVLIILAVISLITFPVIDNSIKSSRERSLERTIDAIEEAAYRYSIENDIGYPSEKQALYLSDIQSKGFLSSSIINPVTNEELAGCVWYYWDTNYNQYVFEYDMECVQTDTEPVINIAYDENLINSNGWAKENIAVTLSGNGDIKYCISSSECEPNEIVETGNNTKFITTEGTSYLCALTSNSLGNSNTLCQSFNLDKTLPTINNVGDLTVNRNEQVNLSSGVTYNDSLSGIDGTVTITPTTIDTSVTGTKQVTYKVQDMAGNVREVIRNIIVDADAPTIVFSFVDSSAINSNGWAKSNFYIRATITDNSGSGIASSNSCTTNSSSECEPTASFTGTTKDFYIESEGSNRACIQVTDNNNKTTKVCSNTYNLDKTNPTAGTATFTGTLGSNSWYTTNITVNVANGSDNLSGHSNTSSNISSITSNTTETIVTITTTDLAGNSASRNYTIKVDKDSPTLTAKDCVVEITEGDSNVVSNYFTASYSISGGSMSCTPTNTSSLTAGSQTLRCTATGGNGLTTTATKQITVKSPYSFATDSWETIASVVRQGLAESAYNIGDEKEVEVSGYGTFTVRIANMSTPTECSNDDFSQTACGFVVEFVDIIFDHSISFSPWNRGGWPSTVMYSFVNTDIYNALPSDLKNIIIDTKVISSHGTNSSTNFTSTDKLYLLATKEVYGKEGASNIINYDSSDDYTRQLDYYNNIGVNTDNYLEVIKNYNGSASDWWLRSAYSNDGYRFIYVDSNGNWGTEMADGPSFGASPAFRIG